MKNNDVKPSLKRYTGGGSKAAVEEYYRNVVGRSRDEEVSASTATQTKVSPSKIKKISRKISDTINVNESILEVLPDMQLAMSVLVSSILSPNDLITRELMFTVDDLGPENSEVVGNMVNSVRKYFTDMIDIGGLSTTVLERALFKTGSYPILTLCHTQIDEIINNNDSVSMESLKPYIDSELTFKSVGLLGPVDGNSEQVVSLESLMDFNEKALSKDKLKVTDNMSVTDNIATLKLPMLLDRLRNDRIDNISLESRGSRKKGTALYRPRKYKSTPVMELHASKELGDKEPILMALPSEAVIPVCVPGSPTEHVGYYIVLDSKTGNPLNTDTSAEGWNRLQRRLNSEETANSASNILDEVRNEMLGKTNVAISDVDELYAAYADHVTNNLRKRVANGAYSEAVEITLDENVLKMMMSRAFMRQNTELLFVLKENVTYIAFDYHANGVGKSLLENGKILASLRAMMLLSNTYAGISNSTPGSILDIELDPNDTDPAKTIETIMGLSEANDRDRYMLGSFDLSSMANGLSRSSKEIAVSNHPKYPQTKVSQSSKTGSVATVDSDLEESLRKRHLQSLSMTPELLDATTEIEFAASYAHSNKLFVKRVIHLQERYAFFLTEFVKEWIELSPQLQDELETHLKDIKKDVERKELAENFMDKIKVSFPRPDTDKLSITMDSFEEYSDALDSALEAYLSQDMFEGLLDNETEDSVESIRAIIKAHYQRCWLRNNNVLPELEDILDTKNGINLLDIQGDVVEGLTDNIFKYLREMRKKGRKQTDGLEKDEEDHERKKEEEEQQDDDLDEGADPGTDDPEDDDQNIDDAVDDEVADDEIVDDEADGAEPL